MEPASKKPEKVETGDLTRRLREVEEPLQKAHPLTYSQKVRCDFKEVVCTVTSEGQAVEKWIEGQSDQTMFGLDIEWKPNRVKGENNKVGLLQISSQTECLLVQLLHLDYIPDSLRNFLRKGSNSFAGVGITEDGIKLLRDHGLVCAGLVELHQYCKGARMSLSLKDLALVVLNVTLEKSRTVTMSDWSQRHLNSEQVEYACRDAWLSCRLFVELEAYPHKRLASVVFAVYEI
ncbi:hypothetical protein R1sor_013077 [Riccia sorocarpa]|uniref:3'-5' exonuclease domain-containing protein n=1 Tax=Riccia sorocarpa TaxID=122646 RepID=A0ABD3H627_9MARC